MRENTFILNGKLWIEINMNINLNKTIDENVENTFGQNFIVFHNNKQISHIRDMNANIIKIMRKPL